MVAVAIAIVITSAGERAEASHVGCGEKVTRDTRLDRDLVNCRNNGIVIGADGVTLNLNGHTIDGDGKPFAACPRGKICDGGVVIAGHNGVTVKHGSVREFEVGVGVGGARRNRVLGVSSTTNRFFGFLIFNSTRSLVRNSSGSGNLAPDGDGMGLFGSRDIRLLHNSFRHNPLGLHVEDSTRTLIKANLFSRSSGPGIFMQADRNQVRRNRCFRNAICVLVSPGDRNVIARNRADRDLAGFWIENGRGNLVTHNVVVGARVTGIRLGLEPPPIGGDHNVVLENLVRASGADGFLVNRKDDRSLLKRNVAVGAGDDGFDVRSRTTKLTGNRAVRNADLGIDAVRGVADGGRNSARGNGDPAQCSNIACG
jgi:nitrous oxidase accessory protein NosD